MQTAAGLIGGAAVARYTVKAVDEVRRLARGREGIPAHARRWRRRLVKPIVKPGLPERRESAMHPRRTDAIQPGAPVDRIGRRKRRARELLGIKSVSHFLRRILPHRQRTLKRLGGKLVAKTAHVFHCLVSCSLSPRERGKKRRGPT